MRTIDTVIFDMDGVIVDSEPIHSEVEQQMFKNEGVTLSPEEHQKFTGTASLEMWTEIVERFSLTTSPDELTRQNNESYLKALQSISTLPAVKGVQQLIRNLHEKKYNLALASSSSRDQIDLIVNRLQLGSYFKVLVSGAELPRSKPDPMIFLETARQLGKAPSQCCVIEDSFHGVTAAKAAGMKCIGYRNPNSGNQDLSGADVIVDSYLTRPVEKILLELSGD
ncbi:MAG TPA: HAD family hydrolase [Balneolaceae bacterium]|nr:HAD family hydrolase [Balneolaceae bacterium]